MKNGFSVSLLLGFCLGFVACCTRTFGQPVNDNFTNRTVLIGNSNVLVFSSAGATIEPGERNGNFTYLRPSVWFSWTAPTNGSADLSYTDGYVTYFGVFHGDQLRSLRSIGPVREFMALETRPGETFQIQAMTPTPYTATMHLLFTPRPPNDNFTNRFRLTGLSIATNGSTHAATRQPGEPRHNQKSFGRSVWYSWVAPASGWVTLELDSDVALVVQPYTGKSVLNQRKTPYMLTSDSPCREFFFARAGLEYNFAVDGKPYFDRVAWDGAFTLKVDFTGLTLMAPTNQTEFEQPPSIELHAEGMLPAIDGPLSELTFSVQDEISKEQTILGPADRDGRLAWTNPPLGYFLVQARSADTNGRALFSNAAEIAIRPSNDAFVDRIAVDGESPAWSVDLTAATRDHGDPHVARYLDDDFDGTTVWYSWSAPDNGQVTLSCDNWTIALAVYTGKPGSFRTVQKPVWGTGLFEAVKGRTYEVLVSDRYPPWAPSHGAMTLTLQPMPAP